MRDPVVGTVDVAVHHGRARPDAQLVCSGDDLDPLVCRELALGQDPAHLVVEDLRRRAGDRVEAGVPGPLEPVAEGQVGTGGTVDDLHGRERMHVHRRDPLLHGRGKVEVRRARQLGVDTALHADLGGPEPPGLLGAVPDLVEVEAVRVRVCASLGERAEAAAGVADVGEVDVAVHHVGDLVPADLPAQVVCEPDDRLSAPRRRRSSVPVPGQSVRLRGSASA